MNDQTDYIPPELGDDGDLGPQVVPEVKQIADAVPAIKDARDAMAEIDRISRPPVTAAQAKVDAIANLTASAYSRASELRLTPEEVKALQADFPDEAFKAGAGGNERLIYIEHAFLRDRLNQVLGLGQWALIPRNRWAEDYEFTNSKGKRVQASRVYVEAMLLVRGCFVGEAVGEMEYYKNNAGQNYGDAVEGAKTAAFRRCCKEFGIGLQAWKKDFGEGWWQRRNTGNARQSRQDGSGTANAPREASRQAPPVKPRLQVTQAWKEWWLRQLDKEGLEMRVVATEFFKKVEPTGLMPNKTLADLPLTHCPASVEQTKDLLAAIHRFGGGDKAGMPWPLNVPPAGQPFPKGKEPEKPGEGSYTPSGPVDPDDPNAPWRAFPVPFGRSAGVKLADLEKKTLYGFWANFVVETSYNGKPRSPNEIAILTQFRAMLDEAGKHYLFTKKD